MPYADPEYKKQHESEYRARPDIRERDAAAYRKRYTDDKNGVRSKKNEYHFLRWDDPKYRKQKQDQYVKRWDRDWSGQKIIQLRAGAKKKGLDFDIDASDIPLPERCPVFGTLLIKGVGRLGNNSPSVDRIDPSRGYIKGNVIVVSMKANSMKREATLDDLKRMVDFYEKLEKQNE